MVSGVASIRVSVGFCFTDVLLLASFVWRQNLTGKRRPFSIPSTRIDHISLKDHWKRYESQQALGAKLSVEAFCNANAMGKTQPDAKEEGLALSTVHTMKGLEYEIVFLMGLGQGTFPDYRALKKVAMLFLRKTITPSWR